MSRWLVALVAVSAVLLSAAGCGRSARTADLPNAGSSTSGATGVLSAEEVRDELQAPPGFTRGASGVDDHGQALLELIPDDGVAKPTSGDGLIVTVPPFVRIEGRPGIGKVVQWAGWPDGAVGSLRRGETFCSFEIEILDSPSIPAGFRLEVAIECGDENAQFGA